MMIQVKVFDMRNDATQEKVVNRWLEAQKASIEITHILQSGAGYTHLLTIFYKSKEKK